MMQTDLILQLALAGMALGLFEGVRPGPLLTMVIRETLTGGWSAGARAASAPIFTDGPLIVISVLLSGWVANQPVLMFTISMLGSCFLVWFGIDCFRIEPPDSDIGQQEVTGSFSRGVITNLLNPNVYVFWFLIGGPLMASAADEEPVGSCGLRTIFPGNDNHRKDGHSPHLRQDTWLYVAKSIQNCIGNLRSGDDRILCWFPVPGV